jgi:hypothetical protein
MVPAPMSALTAHVMRRLWAEGAGHERLTRSGFVAAKPHASAMRRLWAESGRHVVEEGARAQALWHTGLLALAEERALWRLRGCCADRTLPPSAHRSSVFCTG